MIEVVDRSTFLGGSDAAAILGLSPHDTPLDLYLFKVGQKTKVFTQPQLNSMKRGKREEPRIVDDLIDERRIKVVKRSTAAAPNRYADPLEPYLAAEIDFEWEVTAAIADLYDLPGELVGTVQNGEVKTVYIFAADKFGEEGTNEVPIEYYCQAQHGLMVTKREVCLFAVRDGFELSVYLVMRDDEFLEGYREKAMHFWHEYVQKRVPPEPVNLPDVMHWFQSRLASRVSATAEILEKVQQLNRLRDTERTAKEGQDELKFQIGVFMLGEESVEREQPKEEGGKPGKVRATDKLKPGVHLLHSQGTPILQVSMQNSRRVDTDKLKEKYPEQAADCLYSTPSLVFRKPGKKTK